MAAADTVRAARLTRHGEPLTVTEVTLASPGPDEVRVDLRFAGVNPVDRYIAEGRVAPNGPLPRTLGGEGSGVLDGQPVLIAGGGLGSARDGLWAQAANVPRDSVVPVPDGVDLTDVAAMGVAGLTAVNCVRGKARVTSEDRVLVLGASGGVGSMIVSLCASLGAEVWGQTGSEPKAASIREQGASQAVVCGPGELQERVAKLRPTVVFDPLADGFVGAAIESLTEHGRLVSFGTSAGPEVSLNMQSLYRKGITVLGYAGLILSDEERREGLPKALEAVRNGSLRVRVDSVLPLDGVQEAFDRLTARGVQGKLLLDLS